MNRRTDAGGRIAPVDDPVAAREGGRDWLSVALMDARNRLLQRLAQNEDPEPQRIALRAAAHQQHWIIAHVQRGRGEACDPAGVRLAALEPRLHAWSGPEGPVPGADRVRELLAQTLELTLDLLDHAAEDDAGLHFFRQSLLHEDRLTESLDERLRSALPPARVQREPLWMPAQRWLLGSAPGGFVPVNERWAHELAVPPFEIDAQPVNWAQFVEFAEDGGYDRPEFWSAEGWAWAQASGRRSPAQVEQLRGGVVVLRGGGLARAAPAQPVMHLTRHEAEAWCAWAGRRLPTEPEWEIAAATASSRGFVWGDVFEWVAGRARAWPGAPVPVPPGALDRVPDYPAGVLRGASVATSARWRHPKARRFAAADRDFMFCGFRSCAN